MTLQIEDFWTAQQAASVYRLTLEGFAVCNQIGAYIISTKGTRVIVTMERRCGNMRDEVKVSPNGNIHQWDKWRNN